ncbi:uncharacterized protein LOC123259357 [Cotesia glomerata]|nr:uncharacterized protein LOC123259357 [Cotesia glomerata]
MIKKRFSEELAELEKLARIRKLYLSDYTLLKRNPNLSHIVHAALHLSQCMVITSTEIFSHLYHEIHRRLKLKNPHLPSLDGDRDTLLIINIPLNLVMSLGLCFMWLCAKKFSKKNEFSFCGCFIGSILTLVTSIMVMRQSQVQIINAGIHISDVIDHPIFIHDFVTCVLCIFSMSLYQLQFWILYDYLHWRYKRNKLAHDNLEMDRRVNEPSSTSRVTSTSSSTSVTLRNEDPMDIENNRITLYCCCVDYWKYLKRPKRKNRVNYEFQVTYIM